MQLFLIIKDSILADFEDGDKLPILFDEIGDAYVKSKYCEDPEDVYCINSLVYYHVLFEIIKE